MEFIQEQRPEFHYSGVCGSFSEVMLCLTFDISSASEDHFDRHDNDLNTCRQLCITHHVYTVKLFKSRVLNDVIRQGCGLFIFNVLMMLTIFQSPH